MERITKNVFLDKRLLRVKIENIIHFIMLLNGFGVGIIDHDILQDRLHNLGFVYKGENKKHGKIVEK